MPYSIRAETGTPYLFVRLYDDYGLTEARDMLRELAETHASLEGKAVICDMRDGHVHVSWTAAFELAQFFREHGHVFGGVRWSVIAPTSLEFGIVKSTGRATIDVPFEYNVSHDPESACHWAGVPLDLLTALDESRSQSDGDAELAGSPANVETIDLPELLEELRSPMDSLPQPGADIETIDLAEWRALSRDSASGDAQGVA